MQSIRISLSEMPDVPSPFLSMLSTEPPGPSNIGLDREPALLSAPLLRYHGLNEFRGYYRPVCAGSASFWT